MLLILRITLQQLTLIIVGHFWHQIQLLILSLDLLMYLPMHLQATKCSLLLHLPVLLQWFLLLVVAHHLLLTIQPPPATKCEAPSSKAAKKSKKSPKFPKKVATSPQAVKPAKRSANLWLKNCSKLRRQPLRSSSSRPNMTRREKGRRRWEICWERVVSRAVMEWWKLVCSSCSLGTRYVFILLKSCFLRFSHWHNSTSGQREGTQSHSRGHQWFKLRNSAGCATRSAPLSGSL